MHMSPIGLPMIEGVEKHYGLPKEALPLKQQMILFLEEIPGKDITQRDALRAQIDALSGWLVREELEGRAHKGAKKLIAGGMSLYAWWERYRFERMERRYYDEINRLD